MATEELDVDLAARENLRKLGYTQEVSRRPCRVTVCYTFSSFMIWLSWQSVGHLYFRIKHFHVLVKPTVLQPLITTSLVGGGPAVMVWGCLLVSAVIQALALVRRDMFQVPHICRWILLVFPSSLAQVQGLTLSDQRMAIAMVGVWTIALSVTFGIGAAH